MSRLQRYLFLFLCLGIAIVVLLRPVKTRMFAEPLIAKDDIGEYLVLGPFPLTDLWRKGKGVEVFGADVGEREDEIRKTLGGCKVFLIDKRSRNKGKWMLTKDREYPTAVVEGPFYYEVKGNGIKNDFIVQVRNVNVAISSTDYDADPSWRKGSIMGEFAFKGNFPIFKSGSFQLTSSILYDINGKSQFQLQERKEKTEKKKDGKGDGKGGETRDGKRDATSN